MHSMQPHRRRCLLFCTAESRGPRGLCSAERDRRISSTDRICLQEALHENAMGDLSTTLCRGVARPVIPSMSLQARMDGRAVLPGLPVPTDGL